ncbi:serine/threonine kinase [Schistosoma mansoni]|uniref:serine/threonine kinase n=1 Tax=Schistosoma mansoni TaxID=6183 RepID=UPI00022DC1EB|nr:serine/threonine kinase [Schistosoma mansoni]|eukprot:XP_018648981.1 serine/threonine kinase [Schistosoma mansoni]
MFNLPERMVVDFHVENCNNLMINVVIDAEYLHDIQLDQVSINLDQQEIKFDHDYYNENKVIDQ